MDIRSFAKKYGTNTPDLMIALLLDDDCEKDEKFKATVREMVADLTSVLKTVNSPIEKPSIRVTESEVRCEFEGQDVAEHDYRDVVDFCLTFPEVQNLNPGSDYTEQYHNIECYAEALIVVFRKEQQD